MPSPNRIAPDQEELMLAQTITAQLAVEAVLATPQQPGRVLQTFGDFLLVCSIMDVRVEPVHDIQKHATDNLLSVGISPDEACRVGALAARPRVTRAIAKLSYRPGYQLIPGAIDYGKGVELDGSKFIRSILDNAKITQPIS